MKRIIVFLILVMGNGFFFKLQAGTSSYRILNRIELPGNTWWDYLSFDTLSDRLFVSRGSMVQVVEIKDKRLVGDIPNTKGVHGIAIADDLEKGFVSDGADSTVTIFDLKTLRIIKRVYVTGADPDAILYDSYSQKVFTCNGKSSNSTVIDAKTDRVVKTISLSGRPEFCVSDGNGNVYVNIEDKNQIDEINTSTMKVTNVWSISPGQGPTGLAIDAKNHILFSVCRNKLMVIVDAMNGKVITTLPIGARVDGAAFDPSLKRAYSSNGDGSLTVVQEENRNNYRVIGNFKTEFGARTIALDPRSGHLYLPTAEFNLPQHTSDTSYPRPVMKPNSFVVLEIGEVK
jgi:YVTN family beta-propeller protein